MKAVIQSMETFSFFIFLVSPSACHNSACADVVVGPAEHQDRSTDHGKAS